MMSRILGSAIVALGVCAAASAQQPNFVVIVADDMGIFDAGAYGHPDIQTPHIDTLAQQGVKYEQAFLTISSCSPSRASIVTGQYPTASGAPNLFDHLPDNRVLMTTPLRDAGYHTALVGKNHLWGTENQWDAFAPDGHENTTGSAAWIQQLRDRPANQPFFMWFAAHDPHRGYGDASSVHDRSDVQLPPNLRDTGATRDDVARYYDEISRLDGYVRDVRDELAAQGVDDDTYIIFMSDNGAPLPDQKTQLTGPGTRTPLIVVKPDAIPANTTTDAVVSAVDLAPTILELAGAGAPDAMQGRSFATTLIDTDAEHRDYAFAERNAHEADKPAMERAAYGDRYTYIRNYLPTVPNDQANDIENAPAWNQLTQAQRDAILNPAPVERLFDRQADPHNTANLADDPAYAAQLNEMRRQTHMWRVTAGDNPVPTEVAPLKLWLNADDISGNGQQGNENVDVGIWHDKSGNNRNLIQSDENARPKTVKVDGKLRVQFDGGDYLYRLSQNIALGFDLSETDNPGATIFIVSRLRTVEGERVLQLGESTSADSGGASYAVQGDESWRFNDGFARFDEHPANELAINVFRLRADGTYGSAEYFLNSPHAAARSDGANLDGLAAITDETILLGGGFGDNGGGVLNPTSLLSDADIAEVLIYQDGLSDMLLNRVGFYLQDKWAVDGSFFNLYGDMNVDGRRDAADIDILAERRGDAMFDIDGDADNDLDDSIFLVNDLLGVDFGDANLDHVVNDADVQILAERYLLSGGWAEADFNGDGVSDLLDLDILAMHHIQGAAHARQTFSDLTGITIPTPGSLPLGGVLFAGLIVRRRMHHRQ